MNCRDIEKLLPEYADKCLDDAKLELVRGHLETCAACRKELAEITELFDFAKPVTAVRADAPDGYFGEVWPALYSRIQQEKLNTKSIPVIERLTDFVRSYRLRTFQLANAAVILIVSVWLYSSYKDDKATPGAGFLRKVVESFSPETTIETGVSDSPVHQQVAGLLNYDLRISEKNIQKMEKFIHPEKQQQMYDSLTDYLAQKLITLDTMTSRDKEGAIEHGTKQKNT